MSRMPLSALLPRVLLPIVILGLGIAGAQALVLTAPKAQRKEPPPRIATVEVLTLGLDDPAAQVEATGVVEAAREVALSAQVGGRVTWTAPALRPGARFSTGDEIARVDPRDYELAVRDAESKLQQATVELQLERGRAELAGREAALLGGQPSPLAAREPQLLLAQQNLRAAEGGLERARLNLERTHIVAPWNAVVVSETLEEGQILQPGAPAVTLVGSDRFRVRVAVPVDRLAMLDVPGLAGPDGGVVPEEAGSAARVVHELPGGGRIEREARVLGLAGQLDPQSRTASLLLAVDAPLDPPPGQLPLLVAAYVRSHIDGRTVAGSVRVPRSALQDGHRVWIVGAEDRLAAREVRVAWQDAEQAWVDEGLQAGDRVVTSPLLLPIEGMVVQVREPPALPSEAGASGEARPR
jgi:RND family efflux transporter MFP subunit